MDELLKSFSIEELEDSLRVKQAVLDTLKNPGYRRSTIADMRRIKIRISRLQQLQRLESKLFEETDQDRLAKIKTLHTEVLKSLGGLDDEEFTSQ